jgi:hypothetical protein
MDLIAAYRAARLDQRAAFHAGPLAASARLDTSEPNSAGQAAPDGRDDNAVPVVDRPLAEYGFGPGMVIRLGQLGLHTAGDLAQADVAQLRAALGDISRLVDVEGWIQTARRDRGIATC